MIGDIFLVIICVVVIGLIVYGIYNKKTTTNKNHEADKYEKMNELKTGYVDKLESKHLTSFYKLFSSK
ncbi:IMV membrane protein [Goatpox virus]|uniref:IMV membrane protein n=1 Tax=Goatpox virus TaxID=186805 RepID=A0A5C0PSV7_9POXV|nr:IMV membrane protein [Goatpox virus]QEJ79402.1 IMV membrane protein [Goatpox virus]QEJ79552.1 IMV membrane protein [Goatpox virus]